MQKEFLLSICIPTYNRSEYLKTCLENLAVQLKDHYIKEKIEIIISDNSSQDNTEDIVKKFQKILGNIKYFKNEKNIGFDENTIKSVLLAKGKYCWNIGDDDLIQNGGIKFIADFLQNNNVALITVGFNSFLDKNTALKFNNGLKNCKISFSDSPEEFWKKGYCQGTFGIFIFNREQWLKINRRNYTKLWAYYEIILKMLPASKMPMAHASCPLVFIGQDYRWNEGGQALFTVCNFKKLLDQLENFGYGRNFINSKRIIMAKNVLPALISAKTFNLKCSFNNFIAIPKSFPEYPFYIILPMLLFFFPNFLFKLLKKIKRGF